MSKETLGKIEKPSVEKYKKDNKRRRIYLVPLFVSGKGKEFPEDYKNKLKKYWKQVEARLSELEGKIGNVKKVYCEMVDRDGREGEKIIQEMDEMIWKMVKAFLNKGAILKGVEDSKLLQDHFDWLRCLSLELKSERVSSFIASFFVKNLRERDRHISSVINKDLDVGEAAVVFIRENNNLEFAQDIQVFRVFPPALNELRYYFQKK
ncbi:hypothetical protein J7K97_05900 [Candidatus Aerophobetes bacterium]|nr:hypothetical protein [Candidatus Aerophobetes bacterium]